MSIDKGDLVCLYRRKTKGMGIVLEHMPNLPERAGLHPKELQEFLRTKPDWSSMQDYKKSVLSQCADADLANLYFRYHTTWAPKQKVSFVKVRWFKKPSAWESYDSNDMDWYPIEWLRKV